MKHGAKKIKGLGMVSPRYECPTIRPTENSYQVPSAGPNPKP